MLFSTRETVRRGGGLERRARNSGYVIIGGTSRGEGVALEAGVVAIAVAEAVSLLIVAWLLVVSFVSGVVGASSLRLTPSNESISSFVRPFDSRNVILRSVVASRISGSARNVFACSSKADLSEDVVVCSSSVAVVSSVGLSEVFCSEVDEALRCHSGMAGLAGLSGILQLS